MMEHDHLLRRPPTGPPRPIEISRRWRLILVAIPWSIVLAFIILFAVFNNATPEGYLFFVGVFPIGLFAFVPNGLLPELDFYTHVVLGWAFYAVFTFMLLFQNQFFQFLKWFGILVLLLALNLVGCQMALKSIKIGCQHNTTPIQKSAANFDAIADSASVR